MPPGKGLSEETSIPQHSPCRQDCSIPRWKSHYSSFPCPTSTPNPRGNSFLGFFALIKSGTTIHLNEVTAAQQSSAPVLGSTSPLHVIDVIVPKMGEKRGKGMYLLANCGICQPGHFWRMGGHQARPAAPPARAQLVFVLPSPCSSYRWPGSSIFHQPLPPLKIPKAASFLLPSIYWNGKFTQSDFSAKMTQARVLN